MMENDLHEKQTKKKTTLNDWKLANVCVDKNISNFFHKLLFVVVLICKPYWAWAWHSLFCIFCCGHIIGHYSDDQSTDSDI
jgi:hypothetical protein